MLLVTEMVQYCSRCRCKVQSRYIPTYIDACRCRGEGEKVSKKEWWKKKNPQINRTSELVRYLRKEASH